MILLATLCAASATFVSTTNDAVPSDAKTTRGVATIASGSYSTTGDVSTRASRLASPVTRNSTVSSDALFTDTTAILSSIQAAFASMQAQLTESKVALAELVEKQAFGTTSMYIKLSAMIDYFTSIRTEQADHTAYLHAQMRMMELSAEMHEMHEPITWDFEELPGEHILTTNQLQFLTQGDFA